jgi:hypothetical protein
LSTSPQQLATLSTTAKGHILVAAVSADGRYLALGDGNELELHEIVSLGEASSLSLSLRRILSNTL